MHGNEELRPKAHGEAGPHAAFGSVFDSILQSLPLGIVTFDSDLKITRANPHAAALLCLEGYIDRSLASGTNGQTLAPLDWTSRLKSTVSSGEPHKFDSITYTCNGKTKLLQILSAPLKEPDTQRIIAGVLLIEDITERVSLQRRLAHTEKLATVGKLASKVAHELNNPMDGILRYINLALRIIEQQHLQKPKEYLTHCRQGLMRMVHIVSELLEFSRSTCAPFEHTRIESIIDEAVKTMESRAEASGIRIARSYAAVPPVRSGNLFHVFCNLVKNAIDAMPDGGTLTISTRLARDNAAVVAFQDTGEGFPPEHAQAIFEPFFTTKEKGKGTGLGLAICKDIIETCRGRITAENAPDGGSIFTVYLPLSTENP
ncbi:MAG TPA: ATP-binding protein [Sedimentisphaerales bacterium]|nr:ATP-binding protein [Sedimentisphaerales bacterium]